MEPQTPARLTKLNRKARPPAGVPGESCCLSRIIEAFILPVRLVADVFVVNPCGQRSRLSTMTSVTYTAFRPGRAGAVGPVPGSDQARLIALLAAHYPALKAVASRPGAEVEVHIDLPTGRVSWPIAGRDAWLFDHVPYDNTAQADAATRSERARRLERELPGTDDGDLEAAQRREANQLGTPPRFDIRMIPLFGLERRDYDGLIPVGTDAQQEAAAEIGRQFQRELNYDFPPYDAERGDTALLIASCRFATTFPIAAGAVGMTQQDEGWILDWIWIHPYERGGRLFADAWGGLERRFGQFHVAGPYSPATSAAMNRLGVATHRLDS